MSKTPPELTVHVGDVRDVLPTLPSESVDCVATSPPFYGLRDYGTGTWEGGDLGCDHVAGSDHRDVDFNERWGRPVGERQQETARVFQFTDVCGKCGAHRTDRQIGLEATAEEWVAELVAVFRECRRVLKPTGTLWVECGDSYASGETGRVDNGATYGRPGAMAKHQRPRSERRYARPPNLKPKNIVGGPWLLAFALRADGWYLRQCIVWHKPNAMPESVRDRCTTAHSYVFLLSKQPRYFFDADAIAEPAAWERWGDQTVPKYEGTPTASGWIKPKSKGELRARSRDGDWQSGGLENGKSTWPDGRQTGRDTGNGSKNARSVWQIPTRGYPGAHFATWPETLVERMLLAGCPERVCGTCGKPRERLTETKTTPTQRVHNGNWDPSSGYGKSGWLPGVQSTQTVGWSDCGHDNYRPGVVLDPFLGAGTTALVARRLGRSCVGVELNPDYAEMARERCREWWKRPDPPVEVDPNQLTLI